MPAATFEQLTAPVTDLRDLGPTALKAWFRLVPDTFTAVFLTALGDLFLESEEGAIHFLDTGAGTLTPVAISREDWKDQMQVPERLAYWFQPAFVSELLGAGYSLSAGELFSPTIPFILGGKQTTANFTPSHWLAHLHVLGQVHRQVKGLPEGTPVTNINIEPW